jgi:hypothetical protein
MHDLYCGMLPIKCIVPISILVRHKLFIGISLVCSIRRKNYILATRLRYIMSMYRWLSVTHYEIKGQYDVFIEVRLQNNNDIKLPLSEKSQATCQGPLVRWWTKGRIDIVLDMPWILASVFTFVLFLFFYPQWPH